MVPAVLAEYAACYQPLRAESLGNAGGFSGSAIWRLTTLAGECCLRCWPAETAANRVAEIHAVLKRAGRAALSFVPVPIAARDGSTWIERRGRVWELAGWLPGEANFLADPNDTRLASAMRALAQFHLAVAPGLNDAARTESQPSPGIQMRWQTFCRWRDGGLARLRDRLRSERPTPLSERAAELLSQFPLHAEPVERTLRSMLDTPLPMQPCIRDIWHDHVLFVSDEVSGIVDFGAMRLDSVAGDLARLLGSFVRDDRIRWARAIEWYDAVRRLSDAERQAIFVFDAANRLLSGFSWLDWVYFQNRTFEQDDAVLDRVDEHLERLRTAT